MLSTKQKSNPSVLFSSVKNQPTTAVEAVHDGECGAQWCSFQQPTTTENRPLPVVLSDERDPPPPPFEC
ncbi:hypothetical protein Hdeb2414_s0017g00507351 [Helianthus debilis subsp. tardiflorus]